MFIKPARDGVNVRDPITKKHLPAGGAEKPETHFWLRKLARGEVVLTEPAKTAPKRAAKKNTESDPQE